ncbi:hypothetical protein AB0K60_34700 [Thermopolyspora sp. NPDC052614]|uniref:hypothetical protein n=1 Tax=Thermopolyspora sp. NPDC052614 TaxID=3155682 RepID=UPI0034191BB1
MTTPPRQATTDTSGGRALLISLAALAMSLLVPLVGVALALFALIVSVRTTGALRRAKSSIAAAVGGIVVSVFSLAFAAFATMVQFSLGEDLAAYNTCMQGAGTLSAQEHCRERLERAIEAKLPFLEPGRFPFLFPFIP